MMTWAIVSTFTYLIWQLCVRAIVFCENVALVLFLCWPDFNVHISDTPFKGISIRSSLMGETLCKPFHFFFFSSRALLAFSTCFETIDLLITHELRPQLLKSSTQSFNFKVSTGWFPFEIWFALRVVYKGTPSYSQQSCNKQRNSIRTSRRL